MATKRRPCYNCEERPEHGGCHDTCPKYLAQKPNYDSPEREATVAYRHYLKEKQKRLRRYR